MRKVFLFSLASVLLFLTLTFSISMQADTEDNSNLSNTEPTELKQTVVDNQADTNVGEANSINDNEVSEQSISPVTDESNNDEKDSKIEKKEEQSTIFSKEEADSIKHAKAISERNKKNLIKTGIIKDESPKKLIVPEKNRTVQNKKAVPNEKEEKVVKSVDESITEISTSEQLEKLLNGKVPVLVYFYADWSAPCDLLDKTMADISNDADGKYEVIKVDVDTSYGLCKQHDVKTLPTVILFVNGKEKERKVGRMIKYQYESMLASI